MPIKITGQAIKEYMAYFITDDDSTKGRDPNINIINDIHNIKGKHLLMFSIQLHKQTHYIQQR